MSKLHKFADLEAEMDTKRVARAKARARREMTRMLLSELRRHAGLTQAQLADRLGIKQPTLSQLEQQQDMRVTTLARLIEALGGRLEITAKMPTGQVTLKQFKASA
jgi:transcriptional regulator with XRE-family HTH domain